MPCWTPPEDSTPEENEPPQGKVHRLRGKCTVFAGIPGTFPAPHSHPFEKRLAALGSRGRGPPQSGGRAWSFRLLDFHKNTTQGKVNRFRRKTRHFLQRWKCQVRRERPVEPVPMQATGESVPFSRKNPALSPGVETAGSYDRFIRYCITCEIQETVTDVAEPG